MGFAKSSVVFLQEHFFTYPSATMTLRSGKVFLQEHWTCFAHNSLSFTADRHCI